MHQTLDAVLESDGIIRLREPFFCKGSRRVLVIVLDEPFSEMSETSLLSEAALAEDWLRPEEDEAWQHLQSER